MYTLFMPYLLWRDNVQLYSLGDILCIGGKEGERAIDKKTAVRKRGDGGGGDGVLGRWW